MAFLEPSVSGCVAGGSRPSPPRCGTREDATGVIAGPAAAVLRAVQRAGTFTAEDLGDSGDPEAPATPATRLREVLAKAYVDVEAYVDGAMEALWAEVGRSESCLGVEKGKLVRVAHAVRIRVVAGDRCVLRVRGLEADQIDTRTFLGVSMPVLQKSSGRVCTQQSPAAAGRGARAAGRAGAAGADQGEDCESWRLRGLGRAARPAPAARRRHARDLPLYDVVLDPYEDRAAEREAEALLDAASRDPAEKWRFVDRCFGDDVPTPPTDCAAALESLRRRLAQTKLTSQQLCVCAALFPAAAVDEVYYRDEVLAGLAHLVVDFEQLETTAKAAPCHLNEEAWRRIVRRLGVLNVKDPRALGGTYNSGSAAARRAAVRRRPDGARRGFVGGAAARPEEEGQEKGACRCNSAEGPDAGDRLSEGFGL